MIRNYRRALAAISGALLLALAPQAQAQSNTATAGQNWPFPANMAPSFEPRFVDVSLHSIKPLVGLPQPIYGVMGIHMVCETPTGVRRLTPFGNAPNRILDLPRDRASKQIGLIWRGGAGTRRFAYDRACIDQGRLAIQIQSNLKKRASVKSRDVSYGFVNTVIYFDTLPGLNVTNEYATGVQKGVWELFGVHTGGAQRSVRPTADVFSMGGEIRLIR